MWHPIKHYKTIHHHKMLVMQGCFRCGLYWQGLTHDLSKLSPVEFWAGAKYWQGTCSPNNAQRKAEGYSAAWLHHKGRNKHHLEYWIDYAPNGDHAMAGMRMPNRYVAEMVCDRIAASKNYKGASYTDAAAWEYYEHSRDHYILHPETRKQLETCLLILRDEGEDECFRYIRTQLLGYRHQPRRGAHCAPVCHFYEMFCLWADTSIGPCEGSYPQGKSKFLINLLHHPPQGFGTVKTVPYRALYN